MTRSGDVVGGRFEVLIGPVAIQGVDDCMDPRCSHRYSEDGEMLPGCMGYHCPHCGEACGMTGHLKSSRYVDGVYRPFADGQDALSCQPGFDEIPVVTEPAA